MFMRARVIFIISLLIITTFVSLFIHVSRDTNRKISNSPQIQIHSPTPSENVFTLLVLGYPGGKHEGAFLTDTIFLIKINITKRTVHLLSLPRDLWVEFITEDKTDITKINTLYQKDRFNKNKKTHTISGDTQLIRTTIDTITSVPIDRVILVNFEGFENIIDLLGGIDVFVNKSFEDLEYPIEGKESDTCGKETTELKEAFKIATKEAHLLFPCRYETIMFQQGVIRMDGKTALKYARSRHGAGQEGDFARSKRQLYILEGIKNKLFSPPVITKLIPLFDTFRKYILTDIDTSEISKLLQEVPNMKQYLIYSFELGLDNVLITDYSSDGQYILVPKAGANNWQEVKLFIKDSFSTNTLTPPLSTRTK